MEDICSLSTGVSRRPQTKILSIWKPQLAAREEIPERVFMCSDLYVATLNGRTDEVAGLLSGNSSTAAEAASRRPSPAARQRAKAIHPEARCSTGEVTADGSTLLHLAAGQGHCELITELCRRDSALLSSLTSSLDTPLHCAARAGHADAVEAVVRLAWDNNVEEDMLRLVLRGKNKAGDTALHLA